MATVFCDPGLATGNDDGTDWEDAYQSLQDAIDNAGSGDEIWVKSRTITLTARIDFDNSNANSVYGGFANDLTGTNGSVAGRDLDTNITTLDGSDTYRCAYINNQSYTIDGLKFFDGYNASLGGGMQIYLTSGTATIKNCVFDSNRSASGGAIYLSGGGTADFDDCTFSNNSGISGGVIYLSTSPATFDNCTFDSNSGSSAGSGVYASGSGAVTTITDCTFEDNTCSGYTGGAVTGGSSSDITIVRCVFDNNTGATVGGAIYVGACCLSVTNSILINNGAGYGAGLYLSGGSENYILTNNTVSDNAATTDGGSIRNTGGATTDVTNCILYGNTAGGSADEIANAATINVTYSCVEGGYTGTGNTSSDPDFVGTGDDPYSIGSSSSCIDAADSGATDYPSTDYLGNARVDDPNTTNTGTGTPDYADIGAYEYQPPAAEGSLLLALN